MKSDDLGSRSITSLLASYPYLTDFFAAIGVADLVSSLPLERFIAELPIELLEQNSLTSDVLLRQCLDFIAQMELFRQSELSPVQEITIKKGVDKSGQPEREDVVLRIGEVVAVVGPTGSGKSRLLGDIECLAQRDTPSRRQILLDGRIPDEKKRLAGEQQLVAQLSQNMNFVMDLTVAEFLTMHAESRLVADIESRVEKIFATAVELAGEPFTLATPVTSLSGGQSRALMIADVACLSVSPIVLIDEIENAGVDRQRALQLLVQEEKIVLIATHDPLLALSADRRLVIKNGGVWADRVTTTEERHIIEELLHYDQRIGLLRDKIRNGGPIV